MGQTYISPSACTLTDCLIIHHSLSSFSQSFKHARIESGEKSLRGTAYAWESSHAKKFVCTR